MAYVRQMEPGEADDPLLRKIYDDAVRRAGRVWNIVKVTSLDARMTRAHLGLYREVMLGSGPLPPRLRETLAVVVSRANDCHY